MGARTSQCFVKNGGAVEEAIDNQLEQPQVPKAEDVAQSLEAKAGGSESHEPRASLPEPDPEQGLSPREALSAGASVEPIVAAEKAASAKAVAETAALEKAAAEKAAVAAQSVNAAAEQASAEKLAVEKKAAEEKAAVEKATAAAAEKAAADEKKVAEETTAAEKAAAAKVAAATEKAAAEGLAVEEVEKAAAAKVAAEKTAAEKLVAETKAAAEKQAAEEPATSSKPVEATAAVGKAPEYLESLNKADSKPSLTNEKRVDPLDGRPYTFEQLSAFYRGKFNESELQTYWEKECKQGKQVPKKKGNNKQKNRA